MRARLADQAAVRLDAALEDNRARVRRQLGRDWAWATDEVMSDLTIRTIRRLDYWHRTNTDRAEGGATSLAAFVNQLTGTVVGEWFKTQRPKHRTGMTQTPERRAGRLKPPTDPDDRTAWERWRRHEQTLADSDVICDASDIFEGRDGDGETPDRPPRATGKATGNGTATRRTPHCRSAPDTRRTWRPSPSRSRPNGDSPHGNGS